MRKYFCGKAGEIGRFKLVGQPIAKRAKNRRAENDAGGDFADGERLMQKFFPEPAKNKRSGDDDHPLDQNEGQMAFDGAGIHKWQMRRLADTNLPSARQGIIRLSAESREPIYNLPLA